MNLLNRDLASMAGARCLVTGGASGLGLELVRLLAADGARVLVADVHEQAPAGLPEGVEYRRLDVRVDEQWDEARVDVETRWGGLDLLVLNAGIAVGGRIEVTSLEDWQRIVDINLLGVVRGFHSFVPMMKQAGSGRIVVTASAAGLVHPPAMSAYNAVKAGVVALAETTRAELAPAGITVSAICPSFFRTNLHESLHGKDVEMEQTATSLITDAPRTAAQVASSAYAQIRAGKHLVLPDGEARFAFYGKRFARPVYDRVMLFVGGRVDKGGEPLPGPVARVRKRQGERAAARRAA